MIGVRILVSIIPAVTEVISSAAFSGGIIGGVISVGGNAESSIEQTSNQLNTTISDIRNALLGTEEPITIDQWEQIRSRLPRRMAIVLNPDMKEELIL